ncbi:MULTISPECIES: 2Fe-2S iron-sulfur cluster-binding protein [unclassified Marinobacterium]|jgi:2Fe-2S ferredoxin|uniref:2Fe-2S iron-sulfur cluster-binding protein n=1 Tax=unclassified Marinobacterium TaxID=2644139 RepID=UPI0032E663E1
MSIQIHVIDANGHQQRLQADPGSSLMELLRDQSSGVEGICGGCCACGTCHIVLESDWQPLLGTAQPEEEALLDALDERTSGSRLSCQLRLSQEMDGLSLRIVPAEC